MKNRKISTIFFIYKGFIFLFQIFVFPYLLWRFFLGKENFSRLFERLGYTKKTRPPGKLIWIHASSVGETVAIFPVIEKILNSFHVNILVTTGTVSASIILEKRFQKRVIHQYSPLDFPSFVNRFLNYWEPNLSLVSESEIWPIRIYELYFRKIPQILLNAKLSLQTYKTWKKYKFFSCEIFPKFSYVICQSNLDAIRYSDLGVENVAISGNLKVYSILKHNFKDKKIFSQAIGSRSSWAAVSTHEGEEEIAIEVHKIVSQHYPNLLTIIVPRHLNRISSIIKLLKKKHSFVQKSLCEIPKNDTEILLGDTFGDMGLYLRLTEIVFVGKSLRKDVGGGHNPLEPAMVGASILSGPYIDNFRQIYEELKKNQGVIFVKDAEILAKKILLLLRDHRLKKEMILNSRKTVLQLHGSLEKTFNILNPFLKSLFSL